jgi:energy-coupling factor transporter ATP-binding protein EcfA2
VSPILSFHRVTYHYPGSEEPALDDVSLDIEPGELCLLAGLSGHGKSTLLRAACGLVPHFHGGRFAGTVTLAGMDTREHGPARLGTVAGALFQDPETQLVTSSVRSELTLSLESHSGQGAGAIARGVEEVALALGIDALLERSVHELSGGEQQRVALGAALAGRPPVILLDEPTSQLDPVAGDELIGLLRRLNQEWETTVLLAEHRLERCLSAADRVIAMRSGRIAHDGDPASFLAWAARESPALQTPGAKLFALAGLDPLPVGVRQARAALREHRLLPEDVHTVLIAADSAPAAPPAAAAPPAVVPVPLTVFAPAAVPVSATAPAAAAPVAPAPAPAEDHASAAGEDRRGKAGRRTARRRRATALMRMRGVWHELRDGPAILRGVELTLQPGEMVALMGRNGAGKSTLLRHAAGLLEPTRGRIERAGRVALLLQNPGDYFVHEHVREETSAAALRSVGLAHMSERNPRDLSGGERQRLALAIVAGDGAQSPGGPPVVLALDEPTRGMDREAKAELALELRRRAARGLAVIVATHDPEFAASCAQRAVLLADGRVIADGPATELLAGGWYFATETARILGGADGALLPEQGAELLAVRAGVTAGAARNAPGAVARNAPGAVARAPGSRPTDAATIVPGLVR